MLHIDNDSTLVGTTELRSKMPELTKTLKTRKVIVVKRGVPIAILQSFEDYKEKEEILDTFEDVVLGRLAKERDKNTSEKDFVSTEEIEKKYV